MKRVKSHYDLIKLITYIRRQKPTTKDLVAAGDSKPWALDDYLLPLDLDDPWLWADVGLVEDDVEEGMEPKYVNAENGVVTLSKEDFDELQVIITSYYMFVIVGLILSFLIFYAYSIYQNNLLFIDPIFFV